MHITYTWGTAVGGPGSIGRVGKVTLKHWYTEKSKNHSMSQWGCTYRLLDVVHRLASGKVGEIRKGRWRREDIRAVCQGRRVGTKLTHLLENKLEAILELSLVCCRGHKSRDKGPKRIAAYCRRIATRKRCGRHERVVDRRVDGTRPGAGTQRHPEYLRIDCHKCQYIRVSCESTKTYPGKRIPRS